MEPCGGALWGGGGERVGLTLHRSRCKHTHDDTMIRLIQDATQHITCHYRLVFRCATYQSMSRTCVVFLTTTITGSIWDATGILGPFETDTHCCNLSSPHHYGVTSGNSGNTFTYMFPCLTHSTYKETRDLVYYGETHCNMDLQNHRVGRTYLNCEWMRQYLANQLIKQYINHPALVQYMAMSYVQVASGPSRQPQFCILPYRCQVWGIWGCGEWCVVLRLVLA